MVYISNFTNYIKEDNYFHLKKENPLFVGKAQSNVLTPIKGSCVIILSSPYSDKLKRVFMGIVDKVIDERKVIFETQYYIVKEYINGKIWYDKVILDRKKYLNMSSDSLVLNQNKTPLWEKSTQLPRGQFFNQYQNKLKELLYREDIYVFKSNNLPNKEFI